MILILPCSKILAFIICINVATEKDCQSS